MWDSTEAAPRRKPALLGTTLAQLASPRCRSFECPQRDSNHVLGKVRLPSRWTNETNEVPSRYEEAASFGPCEQNKVPRHDPTSQGHRRARRCGPAPGLSWGRSGLSRAPGSSRGRSGLSRTHRSSGGQTRKGLRRPAVTLGVNGVVADRERAIALARRLADSRLGWWRRVFRCPGAMRHVGKGVWTLVLAPQFNGREDDTDVLDSFLSRIGWWFSARRSGRTRRVGDSHGLSIPMRIGLPCTTPGVPQTR